MATKKEKNKDEVLTPAAVVQPRQDLVLQGDPDKQIEFAQKAATALMKVVKPMDIQGKPYLMFGGWQTLGRFFGATVGIEWTTPLKDEKGKLLGYEARAIVYQNGGTISSAEASCMVTERRWAKADEYAIKSMAQTRASAKALRNAFGWVAELAVDPRSGKNLSSTPAEEMMDLDRSEVPPNARVHTYGAEEVPELVCADSGVSISQAEFDYSMKFYGKPLSRAAQKNNTRIR